MKIECGKGWASLYEPLLERCRVEGVEVECVQQKYGALRIHHGAASEDLSAVIEEAEERSLTICEVCGESGALREGAWLTTRCDQHVSGRKPA